MTVTETIEHQRLVEDRKKKAYWRRWGPYLSERQWGTVREDYSANGDAWNYFPHDHARSRAYRWGEDGLGGISDNHQRLCFAIALWNEKDPILKERLFGLTNVEGNHGEDVKEQYYYLDSTPTHSYMKFLYKYPQSAFPYKKLVELNKRRTRNDPEYELLDTGIFQNDRYFDVIIEYAKVTDEDILIKIRIINQGNHTAPIHVIPMLWFRNTWSWKNGVKKPELRLTRTESALEASHPTLGKRWLFSENMENQPILFTENETNHEKLFGQQNQSNYVKDAFHSYIIEEDRNAVNPSQKGTKAGIHYQFTLESRSNIEIRLRLSKRVEAKNPFGEEFDAIVSKRKEEADRFYSYFSNAASGELGSIQRQAFAGLLWNKQFYHYIVEDWLTGDKIVPPIDRLQGRNHEWIHIYAEDILSMPDKWEYPWFASWDIAFHITALAIIDPDFAKKQLLHLTREWYMHPNGQIPAYEWNFNDVNPPVHAWAAWQIYEHEKKIYGKNDRLFLERVFQKLLLNFTWWVNRKDREGKNIFQGGFLGLDNVSLFDRSGKHLEHDIPFASLDQADGTAWMGVYCLNMMRIALELAQKNPAYEDIACKFFVHFLYIASAMQTI
ncbi:MAG: glucosidase, partial [Candidatus Bathyarchaeota archaeon]